MGRRLAQAAPATGIGVARVLVRAPLAASLLASAFKPSSHVYIDR
jgi:hypothetical protein